MSITQSESQTPYRSRELKQPTGTAKIWLEKMNGGLKVAMHAESSTKTNSSGGVLYWKRCRIDNCLGEAISQNSECLKHADQTPRDLYVSQAVQKRSPVTLRGVEVTQDLIDYLRSTSIIENNVVKVPITLAGADVSAKLDFSNFEFKGSFNILGAIFHNPVSFHETTFHQDFSAGYTFFNRASIGFQKCTFKKATNLSYVCTEDGVGFSECDFYGPFNAEGIESGLTLGWCSLKSDLIIRGANAKVIRLENCNLVGELDAHETHCTWFLVNFFQSQSAHQIGPMYVLTDFTLRHSQFNSRIHIEVKAIKLDFEGTRLVDGGTILAHGGRLYLKKLSVHRASLRISGVSDNNMEQPTIVDLQNADAGSMAFSNVDMSCCIFNGSQNLADIAIDPPVEFRMVPSWWRSKRPCIAEEFGWRRNLGRFLSDDWKLPGTRLPNEPQPRLTGIELIELPVIPASQLEGIYRNLRRSFERKADGPSAGDFHYGEMEMRRHDPERPWHERTIIFLYWIFSGYGLRASRAILWYFILLGFAAFLMINYGFENYGKSFWEGLLFSFRSTIPGLDNKMGLTMIGKAIEALTRILGPVLFALAALAIRARVKR